MEIRQMYYFVELAKTLNLTSAASQLYMTPQALSKSMRLLADEFGTDIFIRENGKLALSPFGIILYKELTSLITSIEMTQNHLLDIANQEKGFIRIASSHGIISGKFSQKVETYKKSNASILFDIIELPDMFAEQYLEQDNCDIGFCVNLPVHHEIFESHLLEHYQLCIVVALNHPLAKEETVTLGQISNYPIVTKNNIFKVFNLVENLAKRQKIHLNYALTSSNEIVWKQMVDEGKGVGIGTMYYYDTNFKNEYKVIPFEEVELCWDIYLVWKKSHFLSKHTKDFINYLKTMNKD